MLDPAANVSSSTLNDKDEYYERCIHLAKLNKTLRKSWKKQKKKNKKLKKLNNDLKQRLDMVLKSDRLQTFKEYTIDISFPDHNDNGINVYLNNAYEGSLCLTIEESDGKVYYINYRTFKVQCIRDSINRADLIADSILLSPLSIQFNQQYRTFIHLTRIVGNIFRFVIELENIDTGYIEYINILPGTEANQERLLDYMEGKLSDKFYMGDDINFYNFNELAKKGENNEV